MTTVRILAALLFSVSAFAADPCHYPTAPPNCKTLGQQLTDNAIGLRGAVAESGAQIGQARSRFFATYPDKPGAAEARAEFWNALAEKDFYYLNLFLANNDAKAGTVNADPDVTRRVFETIGGKLDGGIRQTALPEFRDWAAEIKKNVGPTDITNGLTLPARLMKALPLSAEKYDAYLMQRDWAEFEAAGREPAGMDDPALYFPAICMRFQEIKWSAAVQEYNGMVKALGADAVNRAVEQVRKAPRDAGRRLLAVNTRDPVRRGPRGEIVEDYTVPEPEGVIGVVASPIKAVERLAIQGNDRGYLIWLLTARTGDFRMSPVGVHAYKWSFAETVYRRYVMAFGEPAVLEASRKVRTAVKRMTDGSVMDPKAIGGSTRNSPYYVFEDIVTRKDPRGYVRALLTFNGQLNSTAEVDAAYQKFVSTNNETAVLEAARKMAAGTPYPTSAADLKTLTGALNGSQALEKPAVTLVDNPDFLAWRGFSPGAKVTYAFRGLIQGPGGSNDLVPGRVDDRQAFLLRSINDEQVILSRTERAYEADGRPHPPRDMDIGYPAKMAPPKAPAGTVIGRGQETLTIAGKSIATRWQSVSSPYGNCTMVTKTWTSDAVPSGLVRKTEVSNCLEYPKRETILESFEGVNLL